MARRSKPGEKLITNHEREAWIHNDEGLYGWWKRSKLKKSEFTRQNRDEIDSHILRCLKKK